MIGSTVGRVERLIHGPPTEVSMFGRDREVGRVEELVRSIE
jgi:hypothetical protein